MNLYTLPGNFQIPIAANCNLHCTNCGFMDYEMTGKSTLIKNITLDGVKSIDKKITDLNLRLEEIELFGGEPTINPEFNFAMPKVVKEKAIKIDKPEHAIYIKCDVHPWMKSYISVFNHPYYSVTDDTGYYKIDNIPPGTYEVIVWQEKFKNKKTKEVIKKKIVAWFL